MVWSHRYGTLFGYPAWVALSGSHTYVLAVPPNSDGTQVVLADLDTATGNMRWEAPLVGYIAGATGLDFNTSGDAPRILLTGGLVIARTEAERGMSVGGLYAFDANTGAKRWELHPPQLAHDISAESIQYSLEWTELPGIGVIGGPGGVTAVDLRSGRMLWTAPGPADQQGGELVDPAGRVLRGESTGLVIDDATTGRELARSSASGFPDGAGHLIEVKPGSPATARSSGELDHAVGWQTALPFPIPVGSSVENATAVHGSFVAAVSDGSIVVLDTVTGHIQVQAGASGSGDLSLRSTAAGDLLFEVRADGHARAIDLEGHRVLWQRSLGLAAVKVVGQAAGVLYLSGNDGQALTAVDTRTGADLWRTSNPTKVAASGDGIIVIADGSDVSGLR